VVLRSVRHSTYVKSVAEALARRTHAVTLRFDEDGRDVKSVATIESASEGLHAFPAAIRSV
jgi:hypothetical protein